MPNNMNIQTALEIVTDSFRALRVLGDTETSLPQTMATFGFRELCGMLDQWRLDGWLTDNAFATHEFDLVAGKKEYSIGPPLQNNGDADVYADVPPMGITQAFLKDTTTSNMNRTYPVGVVSQEEFYRTARSTTVTSSYSLYLTYKPNPRRAYIEFFPIPATSIKCTLVWPSHVVIPSDINSEMMLTPGMRNAVVYSLANLLTIAYPTDAAPQISAAAIAYTNRLKESKAAPVPAMMMDPSVSVWSTGGRRGGSGKGLYDARTNGYLSSI